MNDFSRDLGKRYDPRGLEAVSTRGGFTLVELLVSFAIFIVILGSVLAIMDGVRKAWERGEYQVDVCQSGRALLGLLERDIRPAIVTPGSPVMQFVQDPSIPASAFTNSNETLVSSTNCNSLFWWTPAETTGFEVCQKGWYLTKTGSNATATDAYLLNRFNLPLTGVKPTPSNQTAYPLTPTLTPTSSAYLFHEKVYWLNLDLGASPSGPSYFKHPSNTSVVSNGTLGFWVQCLDRNGNPIPELSNSSVPYYDSLAAPMRFNSAAYSQMSPPGSTFEDGTTFHYLSPTISGANFDTRYSANELPDSVRVVLLITDERSLIRFYNRIPNYTPPANSAPLNLDAIEDYGRTLSKMGVQNRIFSTTIKLINAQQQ